MARIKWGRTLIVKKANYENKLREQYKEVFEKSAFQGIFWHLIGTGGISVNNTFLTA